MSTKISIGQVSDFPADTARVVQAAGTAVVVNHAGDKFYAVENRCPHLGLPPGAKNVEGTVLTCQFHGSKFDMRSGENLDWVTNFAGAKLPEWSRRLMAMGKKPAPIKTFPVMVEGNQLFIEI
jgi:nitrite reductase/ring-hydroxylating ferredoxin subunit